MRLVDVYNNSAYYDISLQGKLLRDDESSLEMLDIILFQQDFVMWARLIRSDI